MIKKSIDTSPLIVAYTTLCDQHKWQDDPAQIRTLRALEPLYQDLLRKNFFQRLFSSSNTSKGAGVYIYGSVGRGKTILMDLFFDTIPIVQKKRLHFDKFMGSIHHKFHQNQTNNAPQQPIDAVIKSIIDSTKLLCLDEFQVTEIGDAMILARLFTGLIEGGVKIILTSNQSPDQLYHGGLHYDRFRPFVDLLHQKMTVHHLEGPTSLDYRRFKGALGQVYFTPHDAKAIALCSRLFHIYTQEKRASPLTLTVHGRSLIIPKVVDKVGWITFKELCEHPLGPADYQLIATQFYTLFLMEIPLLTPERRNATKRLITLIDALYDHRVHLIVTAAAAPDHLYAPQAPLLPFARTASRLLEMQSEKYLQNEG